LLCVDVTDNELLYLETVHLFVEVRECLYRFFSLEFQLLLLFCSYFFISPISPPSSLTFLFFSSPLQILDHYFGNVCELDLVFGFHKVYCILDEFIIGGEVQETSKKVILERLKEISALET